MEIEEETINLCFVNNNHYKILNKKKNENYDININTDNNKRNKDIKTILKSKINNNKKLKKEDIKIFMNKNWYVSSNYIKYNRIGCEEKYNKKFIYLKNNEYIPDRL